MLEGKLGEWFILVFRIWSKLAGPSKIPQLTLNEDNELEASIDIGVCLFFEAKKIERSTLSRLISNLPKVDNHLMGFCYENVKIWYERALPSCEATKTRMYIPTCVKRRINKIAHCLYPRHWIAEERSMSHLKGYSSKQRVVFMLFNRKEK